MLASCMGTRLFCDCASQIHFGSGVKGENLGWHIDATNSLVHMALSVRGERSLHFRITEEGAEPYVSTFFCSSILFSFSLPSRSSSRCQQVLPMSTVASVCFSGQQLFFSLLRNSSKGLSIPEKAGDVYISSPALFGHAVEYPECMPSHSLLANLRPGINEFVDSLTMLSFFFIQARGRTACALCNSGSTCWSGQSCPS